jgi:hypothetical protein
LEGVEDINTKAEINEWDHATALPTESNGEGMTKPPKLDKQIPIKLADDIIKHLQCWVLMHLFYWTRLLLFQVVALLLLMPSHPGTRNNKIQNALLSRFKLGSRDSESGVVLTEQEVTSSPGLVRCSPFTQTSLASLA